MRSTAILIFLMAAMFGAPAVAQQACPTLMVATNDDEANGDTSSPCALIASPGPDGISLREALVAANNATGSGVVTITFAGALAGTTIALTERFAPITRSQITLTGLTNNGQPNITLDATNASNPGSIFLIATSNFTMSGINMINIPTNFNGMQIGGVAYNLIGQMISSPAQICCLEITGNAFSSSSGSGAFGVYVPANQSNETIANVAITNNSFAQLGEAINIQGGGPSVSNSVIQDVVVFSNTFSQMTLTATSAVEVGAGPTNDTAQRIQIVQNTFIDNFQGFVIDMGGTSSGNLVQDVTVARNVFSGNLGALGIIAGVDPQSNNNTVLNTQIVDNLFDLTGFQGQGTGALEIFGSQSGGTNDNVTNVSFLNNTIYNSDSSAPPGWGVWVRSIGDVTGLSIENTIFGGSQSNPPLNGITSPNRVGNSIINQSGFSGVNNNINVDPLFVNSGAGNFGLQSGSPAIGAGASAGAPALDIDCQPRASPPSIGAYELNGPNICASGPQTLLVSPTTNMSSLGTQSGPFTPASFQYQFSTSGGSINYSISGLPSWLTASSASGTLTTSSPVTFTINSNANTLAAGTYGPITVTISNTTNGQGNTNPTATLTVNPDIFSLSVRETGSGMVTSTPSGINCGSTCSANFNSGTQVTLNETPAAGFAFAGWSGACSGTGSCVVTMNTAESVTATFTQITYTLSVSVSGSGTVTSSPPAINCISTCNASFNSGAQVTLTATPSGGWSFNGWSGACSGTGGCSVTMNSAQSVAANFIVSGSGPGSSTSILFVDPEVGTDTGACPQTAPCATLNYALSKSASGSIIEIESGGVFGPIYIGQPITINGPPDGSASIVWSNTQPGCVAAGVGTCNGGGNANYAIEIAAGTTNNPTIALNNILIDNGTGANGAVHVASAFNVSFKNVVLRGGSGPIAQIMLVDSSQDSQLQLYFINCDIGFSTLGGGLLVAPTSATPVHALFHGGEVHNNLFGLKFDASGLSAGTTIQAGVDNTKLFSFNNSAVTAKAPSGGSVTALLSRSTIANAGSSAFNVNGTNAMGLLFRDTITGNQVGVAALSGGTVYSFDNNEIFGNGTNVSGNLTAVPAQ